MWFDSPGPLLSVFDMGPVSFVFTDDDYDTRLVQQISPSSLQPPQIGVECHLICNLYNTMIVVPFLLVRIG